VKERIDIIVAEDVLAKNGEKRERMRRARAFEPCDRIPVAVNVNQWAGLAARGSTPADYVRSPRDNLREQVLNRKWKIENVRDDEPIPTGSITIQPDLGCLRGVEFPMDITWLDDGPPKCAHPLTAPEQIDALEVPPPDGGLNAKRIEWYEAMREATGDIDVRLNGEPVGIRIALNQPGAPIPSAFALAGSNLLLWTASDPYRVHRLMDITTRSHIQCIRFFDDMLGRDPKHATGLGADAAEMLSPEMFKEFVVPYYARIWEVYEGPRPLHMCGKIDHLLDVLRDDLGVTALNGFGFPVDRDLLAEKMAGRVFLRGGPSPMLIKDGPREAVVAECVDYIEKLGRKSGFVLSSGGGVLPGTPIGHCEAMVEASERAAS